MSAGGRFIAFESDATNLIPGDTNGSRDVFVRDRKTGTTTRVSVGTGGVQGDGDSIYPSISADGRLVAFTSYATNLVPGDTNGGPDVFVRDRKTGTTRRVSLGPGGVQGDVGSGRLAISADGRFVTFESDDTNLVRGDTNEEWDIFVRDLHRGTTRRVSVGPGGVQGNSYSLDPAISADGRFVALESNATNLVPDDTNNALDVFVRTLVP
jgi:Tol biopolymer transport system component